MSKKSVLMLQKKLHELESELTDVFRIPLDTTAYDPRRSMSFHDIEQRLTFLHNLLLAEFNSQPLDYDQLHEIGQRLSALKADFREWNEYRALALDVVPDDNESVCSDCRHHTLLHDEAEAASFPEWNEYDEAASFREWNEYDARALTVPEDTESVCSDCHHHTVKHDDDDDDVDEYDSAVSEQKNTWACLESPDNFPSKAVKKLQASTWRRIGKYSGLFGCGMVIGAISMVKLFSGFGDDFLHHYQPFILPPT